MDELVKRLRFYQSGTLCYKEAADAIEELSRENKEIMLRANQLEAMNDALIGETGATDALIVASKPRWISVSERLPEYDGWYLVYAPDYSGGSSTGLKNIDGKMFCKFYRGKWSIEHGYYKRPGCVTHWLPLPEPPKEVE